MTHSRVAEAEMRSSLWAQQHVWHCCVTIGVKKFYVQVHGTFPMKICHHAEWMLCLTLLLEWVSKLPVHKTLILVRKLLGLSLAYTMDQDSQDFAGR